MKKVVRDIKRGVNKKVLKVPGIEQKVLDATSNEGWGPHGLVLADIALASRNYHEYQMIMAVIWKRINDTGKNWRHVYKALTVLEFLVANGSERVVYDIREHAHQISTLADFQYIDSSGKDQGLNVRRKSQNLVALVNDKELIAEVRQKASANRDKFGSPSSAGGTNKTGDSDDNGHDGRYGREREAGYRGDAHNSRNGDSQSYDGDYSTDHGERNGRDSNRHDDHQYDSRSRSSDTDRGHSLDDDSQRSARGIPRRFSEQNLGAPPSYEEAVSESQTPEHSERDTETQSISAPTHSSPPVSNSESPPKDSPDLSASHIKQEFAGFDEFDPRGSVQAAPTASNNAEVDLLGFSDPFESNHLALTPAVPEPLAPANNGVGPTFGAAAPVSNVAEQPFDDPFGDSPFKAIPSSESAPIHPQTAMPSPFEVAMNESTNHHHHMGGQEPNFDFGNYSPSGSQFPNPDEEIDILADILPPTGPPTVSAPASHSHLSQSSGDFYGDFSLQSGNPSSFSDMSGGLPPQLNDGSHGNYSSQAQTAQSSDGFSADFSSQARNTPSPFSAPDDQSTNNFGDFGPLAVVEAQHGAQFNQGSFFQQHAGAPPSPFDTPSSEPPHLSHTNYGDFGSQMPQAQNGMAMQFNQGNFQNDSGTSVPFSAPSVQPSQMLPQAHNGTTMQFNQGNFQHDSGTSLPFSAPRVQPPTQMLPQAQNGMTMQFNQGNFQQDPGTSLPFSAPSVQPPPQTLPQAQNGTALPFNQGNFQNQAGPPPPFAAPNGQPPQSPFLPPTSQSPQTIPNVEAPHSNPNIFGDFGSQMSQTPNANFQLQAGTPAVPNTQVLQPNNGTAFPQYGSTVPPTSQLGNRGFQPPGGSSAGSLPHMGSQIPNASVNSNGGFSQQQGPQAPFGNSDLFGDWAPPQTGQGSPVTSQPTVPSSIGPLAIVPQPSNKKFETKSTVWADTLSRGLVDLNISGPKTNPLSDIGIDFDTMNRKEKRMEKPKHTPPVSTVTMGKAMGSGTGMGRAGSTALRPSSNPIYGSGMGMGMGGGHGSGMGMGQSPGMGIGGYGNMNQQTMGMGMNQGYNMGMGMGMNQGYNNMGMGMNQGYNPMQQQGGPGMPGYNPMMGGTGSGYPQQSYPQQPYGGGGYR